MEQAGAAASTGIQRILDVEPTELHQRVPFVFGSREEVERIEALHGTEASTPLFNARGLLFRVG